MGLDISANFNNQDDLFILEDYSKIEDSFNLSRTFCNFMCRRDIVEDCRAELDQIGELTGIDINFLYNMQEYTEEWEIQEILEFQDNDDEKNRVKLSFLNKNAQIENNIFDVKNKLTLLIEKLAEIENLENKLEKTNDDTLDNVKYFSNFNLNPGDGYIGNNFGQDLRNLLSQINFGINNGSKTVYFTYY